MPALEAETGYLDALVAALRRLLGSDLVGVYAGGSYALGGYEPGRSDLDVAAVTEGFVARSRLTAVAKAVRHDSLPCPARGLELVVYPLGRVRVPTVAPGFLHNVNTGAGMRERVDYEPVAGERHWFAVDRSVLARHGVALAGPPAKEVFAEPPRAELRRLLADSLRWYLREAPGDESGVLNAWRSLHFARRGEWLAKPAVRVEALAALARAGSAEALLREAVAELDVTSPDAA
ncbi:MAG TPA: nucleotidyltransferase domain-containing protein [Gaiellaceae bacterium]|nr:nucleotidyltransferase domain-containing protein [Gaiellaceae bacterium]